MTEIIQIYPWVCVSVALIVGMWIGGAFGLLGSGLGHAAKKGGANEPA